MNEELDGSVLLAQCTYDPFGPSDSLIIERRKRKRKSIQVEVGITSGCRLRAEQNRAAIKGLVERSLVAAKRLLCESSYYDARSETTSCQRESKSILRISRERLLCRDSRQLDDGRVAISQL